MSCNGDNWNVISEVNHLLLEVADNLAWHSHRREFLHLGAGSFDEFGINLLGLGVQELRGRADGIFTYGFAAQISNSTKKKSSETTA